MIEKCIALYIRLSDDDNDIGDKKQESNSVINQRKVLKDFVKNNPDFSDGHIEEFIDDGFSGVNFERPGIQRLFSEVRKGNVQCIIVKDFSRFGRNYIEAGDYIEQIFPFMGVRFISIGDRYDSAKQQPGIEVGFKNLMHDMYSRDLSRKIKSVKKLYQKQGRYNGGDVPYGYKRRGEKNSVFCPDPDAAQVVKRIFSMAANGSSPVQIADALSADKIPTRGAYKNQTVQQNYRLKNKESNLWTPAAVREIIENEVYTGTYICNKRTTAAPRVMKQNDKSEYIMFENAHEALIDREMFQQAQAIIVRRGKRGRYKKDKNPHVLKGKVKCGYCGYGMIKTVGESGSYCCHMGQRCGHHPSVKIAVIENAILLTIQKYVEVFEEKEEIVHRELQVREAEAAKVKSKIRQLEMKSGNYKVSRMELYKQWKEGRISKEEYLVKKGGYIQKEHESEMELKELNKKIEDILLKRKHFRDKVDSGLSVPVTELTRKLVDSLIERVVVYGSERIEIEWKGKQSWQ